MCGALQELNNTSVFYWQAVHTIIVEAYSKDPSCDHAEKSGTTTNLFIDRELRDNDVVLCVGYD